MGSMPPPSTPPQTLWIIWIALLTSVVFYAVIALYVPIAATDVAPEMVRTMVQLFGGLALCNIGLVFGMRGLFAKRLAYPAYCIVRWALCESAAVLGFVLHVMGASTEVLGAFIAASGFAMVLVRPSDGDLEGYEEARKD
jgi:hypothetical protein